MTCDLNNITSDLLPKPSAPEVMAWSMSKYLTSVFCNTTTPVVMPTTSPSRRNSPMLLTWHQFAATLWRQEKQEPASTLPTEDCQHAAQLSTRTPHIVKPKMASRIGTMNTATPPATRPATAIVYLKYQKYLARNTYDFVTSGQFIISLLTPHTNLIFLLWVPNPTSETELRCFSCCPCSLTKGRLPIDRVAFVFTVFSTLFTFCLGITQYKCTVNIIFFKNKSKNSEVEKDFSSPLYRIDKEIISVS